MQRDLKKLKETAFDLLVIGGGINGAAIAHLAQQNGIQTALVEKNDFSSGTSSKSTKLVHGGIRYLEQLDFALVFEALHERAIQLKAAPHLVKPLPFIIPVYKHDKRPLWFVRLGTMLYDLLAGKARIGPHQLLTAEAVKKAIPGIKLEGLKGGVLYYDAQMDDARLCLENILSAYQYGAVVANYVEMISFLKKDGKVVGVNVRDRLRADVFPVMAKHVICTVGPWTNFILGKDDPHAKKRIRTTKGVHLVYREKFSDQAILLPSAKDGRIYFIIPWFGHSLIGTTDTNYVKDPDSVMPVDRDIRYLLENTQRLFPGRTLTEENVITAFAGLRPLVRQKGSPSRVSRTHRIGVTDSGMFYVAGGKYTTYRKIAEDVLQRVFHLKSQHPFSLYGGGAVHQTPEAVAKKYGVSHESARSVMARYGSRYEDVLSLVSKDEALKNRLCSCSQVLEAEVLYAAEAEFAIKADDIISRRLGLQYIPCESKKCRQTIINFVNQRARLMGGQEIAEAL